jgi:uncharacterized protein YdhG (YjbR/CyaY superfamily)
MKTADVDAYLASVPPDAQAALQKLRQTVAAAAPGAEEGFSYGLPAFRLDGRPLVCYGASKGHCSFYPMSPAVITAHAADLKGFDTSKGTIRFAAEKSLPTSEARRLRCRRLVTRPFARSNISHSVGRSYIDSERFAPHRTAFPSGLRHWF